MPFSNVFMHDQSDFRKRWIKELAISLLHATLTLKYVRSSSWFCLTFFYKLNEYTVKKTPVYLGSKCKVWMFGSLEHCQLNKFLYFPRI